MEKPYEPITLPPVGHAAAPEFQPSFPIASIEMNEDIHPREKLYDKEVERHRKRLTKYGKLDPLLLFVDWNDEVYLVDGVHRLAAYRAESKAHAPVELRRGSKREAQLEAIRINARHGKKLTSKEKQAAAATILNDPDAYGLTDSELAEMVGCDPKTAKKVWIAHPVASKFRPDVRNARQRGGGRRTLNVAPIGKRKTAEAPAGEHHPDEWCVYKVGERGGVTALVGQTQELRGQGGRKIEGSDDSSMPAVYNHQQPFRPAELNPSDAADLMRKLSAAIEDLGDPRALGEVIARCPDAAVRTQFDNFVRFACNVLDAYQGQRRAAVQSTAKEASDASE